MIFASVPVLQPPSEMQDTRHFWDVEGPHLLLVDNTTAGEWADVANEHGWSYLHWGHNVGVCSAWNQARAWFFNLAGRDHDLLFLYSSSVRFDDGLRAVLGQLQEAANWKGCQSGFGPHAIAWSRRVLEIAGTWDENYVSYVGDTDMFYRLIIEGILVAGPDAMPRIELNAPEPEDGRAIRRTGLITNTVLCSEYFRRKWGNDPSEEQWSSPFNSGLPSWWWSPAVRPALDHFDPWRNEYRDSVAP